MEIGLDFPYCSNPLRNDLESYALASTLHGRGKEPVASVCG